MHSPVHQFSCRFHRPQGGTCRSQQYFRFHGIQNRQAQHLGHIEQILRPGAAVHPLGGNRHIQPLLGNMIIEAALGQNIALGILGADGKQNGSPLLLGQGSDFIAGIVPLTGGQRAAVGSLPAAGGVLPAEGDAVHIPPIHFHIDTLLGRLAFRCPDTPLSGVGLENHLIDLTSHRDGHIKVPAGKPAPKAAEAKAHIELVFPLLGIVTAEAPGEGTGICAPDVNTSCRRIHRQDGGILTRPEAKNLPAVPCRQKHPAQHQCQNQRNRKDPPNDFHISSSFLRKAYKPRYAAFRFGIRQHRMILFSL